MRILRVENRGTNQGDITISLPLDEYNMLYNAAYLYSRDYPKAVENKEKYNDMFRQMRFARDLINYGVITDTVIAATCGISKEDWK